MRKDASVIALVSIAHCVSHFYQLLLAPLFPFIKADLGVSYAALGFLVALFYTLSAVFQPLAGFVVDRYGARGVLLGGLGLQVAGVLLAAAAGSYATLAVAAAIIGLGNSVFHPADFAVLNARVSVPRLGYAYSAHGVVGFVGYAVAPLFSVGLAAAFDWHVALYAGAAVGGAVLALLAFNASQLEVKREVPARAHAPLALDARVLLAAPVLMCFLYFTVYAAGLAGLQSFSVAAIIEQYGVAATFASSVLTAYLVGAALGILAGGFVATRARRHDLVAALGLAAHAALILLVATGALPAAALQAALALAGFASGVIAPSRDLIVRASTPPGATGRVFGFVYSGLDVGSFVMPVFYGWMLDAAAPQAVFYTVAACTVLAVFTVLRLPGRAPLMQRT